MAQYNKVTLLGNLVFDPRAKETANGQGLTELRLAVNNGFGDKKNTLYIDVTAWGKIGENAAKHLKKGSLVLVEGRLQIQEWEKDGEKHNRPQIIATDIQYLDKFGGGPSGDDGAGPTDGSYNSGSDGPKPAATRKRSNPDPVVGDDDNLPF